MRHFLKFALCVLVFFGFGACGGKHSSPESCAEAFIQYIVDGKIDKALDMCVDGNGKPLEGRDKATLNSKLPMLAVEYQKKGKIKSVKANQAIYLDSQKTMARVVVQVEFENNKPNNDDIVVSLINGKWYVSGM